MLELRSASLLKMYGHMHYGYETEGFSRIMKKYCPSSRIMQLPNGSYSKSSDTKLRIDY